jgi:murein DD-endopeptidase MepM/ murein hydrolase activator NlpD
MPLSFHKLVGFVLSMLLLLGSALIPLPVAEATSVHSLEQKKQSNQKQIEHIKAMKHQLQIKEKFVTTNILQNQRLLEDSRSSLQAQGVLLKTTQKQLKDLEETLETALVAQQELSTKVGQRLKSLYTGERIGFLQMLLASGNLSTLLDRMYYKKRIFAQDKVLYHDYIEKTRILQEKKEELVKEKNRLGFTIAKIQTYQSQLQDSMTLDRLLVEKLRTSREAYEMAENQLERESMSIERQILDMTRTGGQVLGSTGRFIAPVIAAITSGFGLRFHPIFHTHRMHTGVDFGARYGAAVHAADGGRVIQSGWGGGYGKMVIINHGTQNGRNLSTLYAHMSSTAVFPGQQVSKGQVVGYVGSTGFATGPHLHFEVRIDGRPVNPLGYLR